MHPAFITIFHTTSFATPASINTLPRKHAAPRTSLPSRPPPRTHLRPAPTCSTPTPTSTTLTQTARVIMAAFQLSSLLTPALLHPLYTPAILFTITTTSAIHQLQAVAFTQLSTIPAVQSAAAPDAHLANVFTMAATALIYLFLPVKPVYVNLPFTATLLTLAAFSAYSYLASERPLRAPGLGAGRVRASGWCLVSQVVKCLAGLVTFVAAFGVLPFGTSSAVSAVYLFQVAINLFASGLLAARTGNSIQFSDGILLSCATICLSRSDILPAFATGVTAVISLAASFQKGNLH